MNKFTFKLMVVLGVFLFVGQAHALQITPDSIIRWTGDQTSQAQINVAIAPYIGSAEELYKQDVGVGGEESGSLKDSYTTTFSNTTEEPSGATITHDGGDFVGPSAYLLVKDGDQSPAWYLFSLSSPPLNWNGTETLELSGFWPGNGSISHVTLYGSTQPVPEPGTMLLLGSGLVGLAGWGRKKFRG